MEHEDRHRKLYPCKVCGQQYPNRYALFKHAKRAGHYRNDGKRLPPKHHVPYKGVTPLSALEFGSRARTPPRARGAELNQAEIRNIYNPEEPASSRTLTNSTPPSVGELSIPKKKRRTDYTEASTSRDVADNPRPANSPSRKGKAPIRGAVNFKRRQPDTTDESSSEDEFDRAGRSTPKDPLDPSDTE